MPKEITPLRRPNPDTPIFYAFQINGSLELKPQTHEKVLGTTFALGMNIVGATSKMSGSGSFADREWGKLKQAFNWALLGERKTMYWLFLVCIEQPPCGTCTRGTSETCCASEVYGVARGKSFLVKYNE